MCLSIFVGTHVHENIISREDLCANAGGSDEAANPKTHCKWTWPFIKSLAEFEYHAIRVTIQIHIFHSTIAELVPDLA